MSEPTDDGQRPARRLVRHFALLAAALLAPALSIGLAASFDLAGRLRAGAEDGLRAAAQAAAGGVAREIEARLEAEDMAVQLAGGAPAAMVLLSAEAPSAGAGELLLAVTRDGREREVPVALKRLALAMGGPGLPSGAFALLLDPAGEVIAGAPAELAPRALPGWVRLALDAGMGGPLQGPGEDRAPLILLPAALPYEGWSLLVGQTRAAFDEGWRAPALRQFAGALLITGIGLGFAAWFAAGLRRGLPRPALAGAAQGAAPCGAPEGAPGGARARGFGTAERRSLAEAAADDRQLLLSIMDSAPDPIFVKDRTLRYVLVNAVASRTLGVTPGEVLGRCDFDIVPAHLAARFGAEDRAVMATGRSAEFEREMTHPASGRRVTLRTLKAPWRGRDGEIIGVVCVARDVTERVEAERRLRAAEAAMRRIARADTLTIMSLGIAHELNQPLTATSNFLRAALRWLDRGAHDPARLAAARGVIEEASAEALRAAEILRRLRDFIGRGETEREELDLAALLVETAGVVGAARPGEEIAIALDLDAGCDVRADRMQLQQVFVNLLRNAVEATEGQAERGLAVALRAAGREASIVVADRGPGLPPEVTERPFEPFVSTRPQGMGIGLAISRTIVEAHGGRIAARPRPGGGTEFVIELPLAAG